MTKTYLTGIFVLLLGTCFAQSTSPQVIASGGDHFKGSNAQISYTIGEPVIDTYQGSNAELTQGFHQTNLTIDGVEDLVDGYALEVFPNPTTQFIVIRSGKKSDTRRS